MPATDTGWMITPDELESWILHETDELIVVNKPPLVICHPSKNGPWSSLIGACRERSGLPRLHIPSRLDRETSGVVVLAKTHSVASRLQRAAAKRRVRKTYWAVLTGTLEDRRNVQTPLGPEQNAVYAGRQRVLSAAEGGRSAETEIVPVAHGGGFTLARIYPKTGRMHQIRVHAASIGFPLAGDKLYPNAELMMEFIRNGFNGRLAAALPLSRQGLHAAEIVFRTPIGEERFRAPLAADLVAFCRDRMNVDAAALERRFYQSE